MNLEASQREFREKIIDCFRTELAGHLKTLDSGLTAVEAGNLQGEELTNVLHTTYRAAHTLKGAARTVGVTIVEQMARSLENVLYALKMGVMESSEELFQACRQTLAAIRVVQITYENNEIIPPYQATLALMELDELWNPQIAMQQYSLNNLKFESPLSAAETVPKVGNFRNVPHEAASSKRNTP
jgi:chemotaxis protein histidine kinase CheA